MIVIRKGLVILMKFDVINVRLFKWSASNVDFLIYAKWIGGDYAKGLDEEWTETEWNKIWKWIIFQSI